MQSTITEWADFFQEFHIYDTKNRLQFQLNTLTVSCLRAGQISGHFDDQYLPIFLKLGPVKARTVVK